MKNIVVLVLILSANYISAQIYSAGLKAGPAFSNISGYYPYISTYKTGINIGGFVDYRFSDHAFISLDALYEQKGYKYEDQDISAKIRIEGIRYYEYLNFPFMFKYKFGKTVKINLTAGTYLGFLLNATETETEIDYSISPPTETTQNSSIMHKTESVDMGFSFGLGFERKVSTKLYLFFDSRINYGSMLIEPDKIFVEETRNKSLSLSFGLAYYLQQIISK